MPAHLIAEEGPHRGLILNLEEGEEWVIGRDPDEVDLVLEDNTVSRKHARLTKTEEGVYIKNLSRVNPLLLNGEEEKQRTLLKEGDQVQIGHTLFLFSEEEIPNLSQEKEAPTAPERTTGGYDEIFGDLEEPKEETPPPEQEEEETPAPSTEISAYDTIFEDSGEEAEVPFSLLPETPLILKVISGPNAGAEIGLEKGHTYTLGKDPNSCEIAFQDLSVSRNHARLVVSKEGEVTIEDLGSKNGTLVNGAAISEKSTVTSQDLIALGTTVFLLIDREAPQETIYSPLLPSVFEKAEKEEEVVEEEKEESLKRDWKREPIPTKYLVLAGSLAAVFLIAFVSFFSLFKSKGIEITYNEPNEQIEEALTKFDAVQFSFNPASGKLFLVGHVLTAVDYAEMQYLIDQFPFVTSTEDTVIIDEYVWKSMNDILSQNGAWRGVSIGSDTPGKFTINGYIQTNEEAIQLFEYLTVNFPYLDRLTSHVVVEENLNAQVESLLLAAGFSAVKLQLANGEVILTGNYSEKRKSDFEDFVEKLDKVPGISHVKNYAVATMPQLAAIDLSQQFHVGGSSQFDGHGYSVVLNGKIYTLGDAVEGMKITEIDPSTILLEKDGLKYKINYTER